jgi:PIN domain
MTEVRGDQKRLFLDTMVFLHYRPLDELDLPLLAQSESVMIVVPRVTLRELDKHKATHQSRKVRGRARRVLAELEHAIRTGLPLKGGIAVEFFSLYPHDQLTGEHLNPNWADDVLVACALAYMARNPGADLSVVSQDVGLRLTCYEHGIATLQLDEDAALPEEVDGAERENRELKRQIQRLQGALPRLEVFHSEPTESGRVASFSVNESREPTERDVDDFLEQCRQRYPKKEIPGEQAQGGGAVVDYSGALDQLLRMGPSAAEVRAYNVSLESYYREAVEHFRAKHEFSRRRLMTISFEIGIRNSGSAPADDVHVVFFFPEWVRLFDEDSVPQEPARPQPPEVPQGRYVVQRGIDSFYTSQNFFSPVLPAPGPVSSFRIEVAAGYEVRDHFDRIKHGMTVRLPKLYIEFPSFAEARSFSCTYELRPANLPDAVKGDLRFNIEEY